MKGKMLFIVLWLMTFVVVLLTVLFLKDNSTPKTPATATPEVVYVVVTATPQPTMVPTASPAWQPPLGTVLIRADCQDCFPIYIDQEIRDTQTTYPEALAICQGLGGSLPTEQQLQVAIDSGLITQVTYPFPTREWTGESYNHNPEYQGWFQVDPQVDQNLVTVIGQNGRKGELWDNASVDLGYRCVFSAP